MRNDDSDDNSSAKNLLDIAQIAEDINVVIRNKTSPTGNNNNNNIV